MSNPIAVIVSALILATAFLANTFLKTWIERDWYLSRPYFELLPTGTSGAVYRLNKYTGQVDLCLLDKCSRVAGTEPFRTGFIAEPPGQAVTPASSDPDKH